MSKKIVSLNKEIKRQRYSWKKKIKEEKLAVGKGGFGGFELLPVLAKS